MKKFASLFLTLLCILCVFVSCGKEDMGQHDTKVIVKTDNEEIEAKHVFKNCMFYTKGKNSEGEWVCDDGIAQFAGALSALESTGSLSDIPTIKYSAPISVNIPENNGKGSFEVYSPDNFKEPIDEFSMTSSFSTLDEGEWYVVFDVSYRGKYIKKDKKYESTTYSYVFKLQVEEE